MFDPLKQGALDGLIVNIDSGYMLKVHEVAPHVLASRDLWLGHVYIIAMNASVWDGLDAADRNAIARAAEIAYRPLGDLMNTSFDTMIADMQKEGVKARTIDIAQARAFETATRHEEAQANWVAAAQARGVKDAGAVLTKLRAMLRQHTQ